MKTTHDCTAEKGEQLNSRWTKRMTAGCDNEAPIFIPKMQQLEQTIQNERCSRFFGTEATTGVGDLDTQNLCPFDDRDAFSATDVGSNFGCVLASVHEKEITLLWVGDEEFLKAVRHHVFGLVIRTVTNLGHWQLTFKATSNSIIDTLWFTPRRFR